MFEILGYCKESSESVIKDNIQVTDEELELGSKLADKIKNYVGI